MLLDKRTRPLCLISSPLENSTPHRDRDNTIIVIARRDAEETQVRSENKP